MSLLIRSGNRHTIDQGSGGEIPYAAVERNKVGVDAQRLKTAPQQTARGNEVHILALRKVLLEPLHSCFKFAGFY